METQDFSCDSGGISPRETRTWQESDCSTEEVMRNPSPGTVRKYLGGGRGSTAPNDQEVDPSERVGWAAGCHLRRPSAH